MTTEEELEALRQQINNLYDMFKNHVHEGTTNKPLIIRELKKESNSI